ncbi:hypothetical protein CC86DRAFT_441644 [Ophiobolus disseminans]|uniref:Amidohydrolase-related domain-containing protein n=1 Tax=Ophiobolus disseminans TaxID=1469910 RepID=A0A6A7AK30_9PLEO|nr:hypothetical protein CC86DRAFT_441644 [Ophiobolus disseminans]
MSFGTVPSATLIACLESYVNPAVPIGTSLSTDATAPALHIIPSATLAKLKNVGPARVKDMRGLGHAKQVVSHVPIAASLATCVRFNDALHVAIHLNAEKIVALALLPAEGRDAVKELQRCVTKMKFVGGVLATYQSTLADTVLAPLASHVHTSHNASPLLILHLYLSSAFDRHPNLRLILAHPGVLPSLLPRIDTLLAHIPAADKPRRSFLDVWQHNFYLTTADVLDISTMRTFLEQIPIDRVLYASNYPLEERGKELMEELRNSGFLSPEEWQRVASGNAELLFGLKKSTVKTAGVK